jgi:hypothetical protein
MKKLGRLKFGAIMGIAVALVFYAGTGAWAQLDTDVPLGHIKLQTALETDWAVSTAVRITATTTITTFLAADRDFPLTATSCRRPSGGSTRQ